jgi:hypothetical protein
VGIVAAAGLEIVAVIAAGGEVLVLHFHTFVHLAEVGVSGGAVDAHPPGL